MDKNGDKKKEKNEMRKKNRDPATAKRANNQISHIIFSKSKMVS